MDKSFPTEVTYRMINQTLDFFEQARDVERQLRQSGLTQEQLSEQLGVSQSYIANKLRLLRLTPDEQREILRAKLSERHSRALLRITQPDERMRALRQMADRQMNVAQAEEYVEDLLCAQSRADELRTRPPEVRSKLLLRDIRAFFSTIDRAVEGIRKCGVCVESTRVEEGGEVLIKIRLPKAV